MDATPSEITEMQNIVQDTESGKEEMFIKDSSERTMGCCKRLQPGKMYKSLGPGQKCEIAGCGK